MLKCGVDAKMLAACQNKADATGTAAAHAYMNLIPNVNV